MRLKRQIPNHVADQFEDLLYDLTDQNLFYRLVRIEGDFYTTFEFDAESGYEERAFWMEVETCLL